MRKINAEKYIGQTRTMNCGLKATIIAYRKFEDIDVKFENGIIHKHRSMSHFRRGNIAPSHSRIKTECIGETNTMSCGMKATVIAYRRCNDIDVKFEDGTIREHVVIDWFRTGKLVPISVSMKTNCIGETNIMSCGMKATIVAYRGCNDIDIQFEDNAIRKHIGIGNFRKGNVQHPTGILFNTYKPEKIAFVFHNKTYFYVTYTKDNCEVMDIMCIDDMKHKLPALAK